MRCLTFTRKNKAMNICYVVGAGDFFGSFTPDEGDLVIAADGGYDELEKRGIRTDVLVGDLDSLKNQPSNVTTVRHPKEKDETDMHLAFLLGRERGYTRFEIYGGTGGRADHTFANYCLLSYIRSCGCRARLYAEGEYAEVIENELTRVTGNPGARISVFAFGGEARGVSIRGLRYTVTDAVMSPLFPLGVSNEFLDTEGEIEVKDGRLLIMREI